MVELSTLPAAEVAAEAAGAVSFADPPMSSSALCDYADETDTKIKR